MKEFDAYKTLDLSKRLAIVRKGEALVLEQVSYGHRKSVVPQVLPSVMRKTVSRQIFESIAPPKRDGSDVMQL